MYQKNQIVKDYFEMWLQLIHFIERGNSLTPASSETTHFCVLSILFYLSILIIFSHLLVPLRYASLCLQFKKYPFAAIIPVMYFNILI